MIKKTILLASLCLVMFSCEKKEGGSSAKPEKVVPGAFTKKPTAGHITEGTIKGKANGETFECKTVYIEPRLGTWNICIADKKLDKPTGFLPRDAQYASVKLTETPEEGKIYKQDLKYGGGFFQLKKVDGEGTTSLNASNSYYIEFTKWDVKDYNEKGKMFQVGGKASGKVYVAYQGGTKFKESVIAGTFEDAVVRYMGKPKFD